MLGQQDAANRAAAATTKASFMKFKIGVCVIYSEASPPDASRLADGIAPARQKTGRNLASPASQAAGGWAVRVAHSEELFRTWRVRGGGEFPPFEGERWRKPKFAFWQPFDRAPAADPPLGTE